jgi:VWFA-related protein
MNTARALIFLPILLLGQDPKEALQEVRIRSGPYSPAKATIAVQTNLVELGVAVRNRQGQPVGGLKVSDFELTDSGKSATITFFEEQKSRHIETGASTSSVASTVPTSVAAVARFIVLFFDDTHTESMSLQKGRDAAKRFVSSGIQAGDRVAIFTGSGSPVADFTSDTKVLLATLDQLKPHAEMGARGYGSCPTLTPYQAFAILRGLDQKVKDDAVAEAARCVQCETVECTASQVGRVQGAAETAWSLFRPQSASVLDRLGLVIRRLATAPGSRVMVLISPGFISGTLEQQSSGLMDAALGARVVINSLDSVGLSANQSQNIQKQVMGEMMSEAATATGGKFIQNNNDLAGGIRSLAEPAEVSYILGFAPTGEPDEKYHALKVKLKNLPDDRVESRPGYFASKVTEKPVESIQQRIDRLASSADSVEQVAATVHASLEEKDGRAIIHVDISLDAKSLKFVEREGRHIQELTFVTIVQDLAGNVVEGKQAVMSLSLTPATLSELQEKGIPAATSFSVPMGSYQVREVIREAVENHMTAKIVDVRQ